DQGLDGAAVVGGKGLSNLSGNFVIVRHDAVPVGGALFFFAHGTEVQLPDDNNPQQDNRGNGVEVHRRGAYEYWHLTHGQRRGREDRSHDADDGRAPARQRNENDGGGRTGIHQVGKLCARGILLIGT